MKTYSEIIELAEIQYPILKTIHDDDLNEGLRYAFIQGCKAAKNNCEPPKIAKPAEQIPALNLIKVEFDKELTLQMEVIDSIADCVSAIKYIPPAYEGVVSTSYPQPCADITDELSSKISAIRVNNEYLMRIRDRLKNIIKPNSNK